MVSDSSRFAETKGDKGGRRERCREAERMVEVKREIRNAP